MTYRTVAGLSHSNKYRAWKYEKEWRMMIADGAMPDEQMSSIEDNYFFKPCKQLIPRESEPRLVEHFNKYATKVDEVVNFCSSS